jgi:hypothetical protein
VNDSWQFAAPEDPAKLVVLGISNEDESTVLNWLQENHRSLRTLLDAAEMTFHEFGVEPIPTLLVANRAGLVEKAIARFYASSDCDGLGTSVIEQIK